MGKRSLYDVFMLICIGIVLTPSVFFAQTCSGNAVTVVSQMGVDFPNNALGVADATAAELWDTGDQIVLDLNKELSLNSTIVVRWRGNTVSTADPTITIELSSDGVSFYPVIGSPFIVARTAAYVNQNINATVVARYVRFTTTNTYNIDLDAVTFTNQACESCGISLSTSVSSCYDNNGNTPSGISQANVSVVVDWSARPTTENIVLKLQGQSDVIINTTTASKAYVHTYLLPADGTTKTVDANFVTTTSCAATQKTVTLPSGSCVNTPCLSGNTGGTVWRDFSSNGVKDATETEGVSGVTVKLFDKTGSLISTTTSDNLGQYTFGTLASAPSPTNKYRIEFSNTPPQYKPTFKGADGNTDVQFISTANCAANYGVNVPTDYCQSNPQLMINCYVTGAYSGGTSAYHTIVSIPYSVIQDVDGNINGTTANGNPTIGTYNPPIYTPAPPSPTSIADHGQVGSTWGLAYDRAARSLYAASYIKSGTSLGPGESTGMIYKISNPNTTNTVSQYVDLNAIFGAGTAGANPHPTSTSNFSALNDAPTNAVIGKVGLGDLAISNDNAFLYVMNLADRMLYKIPTSGTLNSTTITRYAMPTSALPTVTDAAGTAGTCPSADIRPFAVGVHPDGSVYVGGVCSCESISAGFNAISNPASYQLTAYVWKSTGSGFSLVLNESLRFDRDAKGGYRTDDDFTETDKLNTDADWEPWSNLSNAAIYNTSGPSQNEPMLSDISFDEKGDMFIGMRDRIGDCVTLNGGYLSSGDTYKACKTNTGFAFEKNATCGTTTTGGANNHQGPGGGEFFYQDIQGDGIKNSGTGGVFILAGKNQVVTTTSDPVYLTSTGVQFFNPSAGGVQVYGLQDGQIKGAFDLYESTAINTFAKASGIGAISALCDAAPIQIGNYVWNDSNQNGVQEAEETPLSNITVSLWKSGVQVATTTTNSAGQYYFTGIGTSGETWISTTGTDSVLANTAYQIHIDTTNQAQLDTLKLTISNSTLNSGNDQNDSDASISGNYAVININTGNAGENNFTYDFGFARSCDTTLTLTNATICNGSSTNLFNRVSAVQGTLTYSLNGTTWFPLSNPTNVTPSVSTMYYVKDYLTAYCQDIDTLKITVIQPVSAGTGTNPTAYCQAGSGIANLDLFNQLTSETAGGVWSQVSGASVGSALNMSTGILNLNGLVVGAYVFRYSVTGTAPCASDSEDVTVTVNACCPPSICLPASVVRN
jgi:hypothetical protein